MDKSCELYSETMMNSGNGGMRISPFLSTFKDKKDFEIVATICAWMANGWANEEFVAQRYITKTMLPTPSEYILSYNQRVQEIDAYTSFFRVLTNMNLIYLNSRLKSVYEYYGSLEKCFYGTLAHHRKSKYNYEIFADILSGCTGFQTDSSNCSFYRYNLLYYWLTYKHKIWNVYRHEKALLPCNDKIFRNAYKKGITRVLLKTNLPNTKILTKKAKEMYGNYEFFKMYEDLNT